MKFYVFALPILVSLSIMPLPAFAAETAEQHPSHIEQKDRDREEYEKSLEERLGKLGRELDQLKAEAKAMTRHGKKEMSRYIAEAENKQRMAARKLEQMRMESERKWKKFTSDVEFALSEFVKAFEKAHERFRE